MRRTGPSATRVVPAVWRECLGKKASRDTVPNGKPLDERAALRHTGRPYEHPGAAQQPDRHRDDWPPDGFRGHHRHGCGGSEHPDHESDHRAVRGGFARHQSHGGERPGCGQLRRRVEGGAHLHPDGAGGPGGNRVGRAGGAAGAGSFAGSARDAARRGPLPAGVPAWHAVNPAVQLRGGDTSRGRRRAAPHAGAGPLGCVERPSRPAL